MKKLMMILAGTALMVTSAPAFAGNDRPIAVGELPATAQQFIKAHFAGVEVSLSKVDEELFDKDYKVVFVNGAKVEFTKNGEWKDVECKYGEVPAAIVPQQIRDYVAKNYPDRKITAIDRDRRDYEVELDNGLDLKFDLYYSEDGVLLREVPDRDGNDDHGDMLPQELSKAISDFIARKYPGARIVDAEREKGNTEVDIIFAGKALEVCFGTGDAWLWTKTGVRLSEVPDVVRRTLQSSQYGTWVIDDVDLYESPDRVWYAIEVEDPQSEREATVRILEDGTLL